VAVKFVRIVWYDAQDARDTWVSITSEETIKWMDELALVVSYGYLIKKTKNYYIIAADLCDDMTVGRMTKIPCPWVKKIQTVKVPVKKAK